MSDYEVTWVPRLLGFRVTWIPRLLGFRGHMGPSDQANDLGTQVTSEPKWIRNPWVRKKRREEKPHISYV
eukprot:625671-Amorphochlora_amoeboformis.AAC.1